eukprot:TRINITY_DN427_c0_g2_i1.p1 TRINITY_DN427_c0_g2~~TRINITY_DN427_c0_g2_i1.p1  ORF type:complete len:250 (+),score=105.91 TRINITY_DN427_c0_g2_i1:107-751(+)
MSGEEAKREYLFKVLVVGDIGTGKTSIIKRFVHNIFSTNYKSTIGVDFALKVIRWDENTEVRLQLWDIAGQERFGNMTRVYYKEAVGALTVFDVTRVGTFEAVAKWKADIDAKVTLPPNDTPIPVVLLANKCDLPDAADFLANRAQMDRYCTDNGFVGWVETSAKENVNVDKAAKMLVQAILEAEVGGECKDDATVEIGGGSGAAKKPDGDCAC